MTGFALGVICGWVTFAVALAILLARAPAIERPKPCNRSVSPAAAAWRPGDPDPKE